MLYNSQEPHLFCSFAIGSNSRFKSFKALMATTLSSEIWGSANLKAECQSSAANDDHHDEACNNFDGLCKL